MSRERIIWVEHYNENSYKNKSDPVVTFDQVLLSWDDEVLDITDLNGGRCDHTTLAAVRAIN